MRFLETVVSLIILRCDRYLSGIGVNDSLQGFSALEGFVARLDDEAVKDWAKITSDAAPEQAPSAAADIGFTAYDGVVLTGGQSQRLGLLPVTGERERVCAGNAAEELAEASRIGDIADPFSGGDAHVMSARAGVHLPLENALRERPVTVWAGLFRLLFGVLSRNERPPSFFKLVLGLVEKFEKGYIRHRIMIN